MDAAILNIASRLEGLGAEQRGRKPWCGIQVRSRQWDKMSRADQGQKSREGWGIDSDSGCEASAWVESRGVMSCDLFI